METTLLTLHYLSLAVGIGGGAATAVMAGMTKGADPAIAGHVGKVQSRVGDIGFGAIILLWITGIWMVADHGGYAAMPAAFTYKMAGVVTLTLALLAMQVVKRRAMAKGQPPAASTMEGLGRIALLSAIFTVVMAVISFG